MKRLFASGLVVASMAFQVHALAESFPPVADPLVKEECGACHMTYFAEMLPRKSWEIILAGLADHFGENAALDAESLAKISAFHAANAGDVLTSRGAMKWREGLAPGEAPERITAAPRFKRKHPESKLPGWIEKNAAKSPSDCVACHKQAEAGVFDDD